jgi:hypothetical protein
MKRDGKRGMKAPLPTVVAKATESLDVNLSWHGSQIGPVSGSPTTVLCPATTKDMRRDTEYTIRKLIPQWTDWSAWIGCTAEFEEKGQKESCDTRETIPDTRFRIYDTRSQYAAF